MAKRIILIHGRDTKPLEHDLEKLWLDAVKHGLHRDHPEVLPAVESHNGGSNNVKMRFVYYGDLSNAFLHNEQGKPIPDDITSRVAALNTLKTYSTAQFNKTSYKKVSKLGFLMEGLADTFSGALALLRLGKPLVSIVAPDMQEYWNHESYFGSNLRHRLTLELKAAFEADDEVMLVAHSLGSLIAYDTLWKFSHYSEYRFSEYANKKIDLLVTLGSPLSDENVKQQLKGAISKGKNKYPNNIKKWINIAAKDDYISHDSKLANDFEQMYKLGLIESKIKDITGIYNLTVRNGKSNPHSATGYLVHPKFTNVLKEWLNNET